MQLAGWLAGCRAGARAGMASVFVECGVSQLTRAHPRPVAGVVGGGSAARIAKLYDQHSQFSALEGGLFTLGLPATYLQLNDPAAQDTAIEGAVGAVVEGLFCVLATLGVVPIIRCPRGGAAEHVAAQLDARLRDALRSRANLFSEGAGPAGLAASLQRPLLCLFDRNFELSVALQHTWTYKPLVCGGARGLLGEWARASPLAPACSEGCLPARPPHAPRPPPTLAPPPTAGPRCAWHAPKPHHRGRGSCRPRRPAGAAACQEELRGGRRR